MDHPILAVNFQRDQLDLQDRQFDPLQSSRDPPTCHCQLSKLPEPHTCPKLTLTGQCRRTLIVTLGRTLPGRTIQKQRPSFTPRRSLRNTHMMGRSMRFNITTNTTIHSKQAGNKFSLLTTIAALLVFTRNN